MLLNFHVVHLYLVIATGTILPVVLGGAIIGFHTVYLFLYGVFLLTYHHNRVAIGLALAVLAPLLLALLSGFPRAEDFDYGLLKIEGGIIATLLSGLITFHCLRIYGETRFLSSLVHVAFAVLVLTLAYIAAAAFGFIDFSGRFFINGPITYGWIMGTSLLFSIFLFFETKNMKYVVLCAVFSAMLFATGSKGPLLAFAIVGVSYLAINFKNWRAWLAACVTTISFYLSWRYMPDDTVSRYSAFSRMASGLLESDDNGSIGSGDYGSIGIRLEAYRKSWQLFQDNIMFGVGLGNWEKHSEVPILYPHNFALEILSELGFLGAIGFILTLAVITIGIPIWAKSTHTLDQKRCYPDKDHTKKNHYLGILCPATKARLTSAPFIFLCFFVIAQSFSGDLSYLRYMLGLPLGFFLWGHLANPSQKADQL